MLGALMLSGHVSVLTWGAECVAVLTVVWACECASDGAVCSAVLAARGVNCLHVL